MIKVYVTLKPIVIEIDPRVLSAYRDGLNSGSPIGGLDENNGRVEAKDIPMPDFIKAVIMKYVMDELNKDEEVLDGSLIESAMGEDSVIL